MKNSTFRSFVLAVLWAACLLPSPLFPAEPELATEVTLLIGRPSYGPSHDQGALVVPGAVIPVESDSAGFDSAPETGYTDEAVQQGFPRAHRQIGRVASDLVKSLRLGVVELKYWKPLSLRLGEVTELPPPASTSSVRLTIELLGFNESVASYEVKFFEGPITLTNTPLTIRRGQQAVVGGLDGDDAPYIFLLIAPADSGEAESAPVPVRGDIRPPIAIDTTPANYTEQARREQIEGVVILETVIEKDGTVSEVEVLKGLPHGLSEAAAAAIRQWRFEPATKAGEPIAVSYYLTVDFRLSESPQQP